MPQHSELDYAFLTKAGFLLGLGLFVLGGGGEFLGHALYGPLPAWVDTLLFDLEAVGLVIGFFSPFIFGIFLPLTR